MKKFGMFLVMLTLVGYSIGCSKPADTTPPANDNPAPAAPDADPGTETPPPAEG